MILIEIEQNKYFLNYKLIFQMFEVIHVYVLKTKYQKKYNFNVRINVWGSAEHITKRPSFKLLGNKTEDCFCRKQKSAYWAI